jgi:hypothetical protein
MNWQAKMKMNKDDIRALKTKHRLELVMQKTGEAFEMDVEDPNQWHSLTTPGLVLDIRRQMFEITKPDKDIESGDVLAWLRRRYTWSFSMAVRFLQSRAPDPKKDSQPTKAEIKPRIIPNAEDEKAPLDKWQEQALQIGGERMRSYFSRSWADLVMNVDEIRIEPIFAPRIVSCQRCQKNIDWHIEKVMCSHKDRFENTGFTHEHIGSIPVIAYAIKRHFLDLSTLILDGNKDLERIFYELGEDMDALFIEDEIVCPKCAWQELDFQVALNYCKTSAHRRGQIESKE